MRALLLLLAGCSAIPPVVTPRGEPGFFTWRATHTRADQVLVAGDAVCRWRGRDHLRCFDPARGTPWDLRSQVPLLGAPVALEHGWLGLTDRELVRLDDGGQVLWAVPLGVEGVEVQAMTGDEGAAYVAWSTGMLAVQLDDGRERWRQTWPERGRVTVSAVEGRVVVSAAFEDPAGLSTELRALDRDGRVLWSQTWNELAEVLAGEHWLVLTSDRRLLVVDVRTGVGHEPPVPELYNGMAIIDRGRLYLAGGQATGAGSIRAYDLTSGQRLWQVASEVDAYPGLAVVDDLLLVAAQGQSLLALDAASGERVWEVGIGLSMRLFAAGGRVVLDLDTALVGVDLRAPRPPTREVVVKGRIGVVSCRERAHVELRLGHQPVTVDDSGAFVVRLRASGGVVLWDPQSVTGARWLPVDDRQVIDVGAVDLDYCDYD